MRRSKEFAIIVREFADRGEQWLLESPENVRGLLLTVAADIAHRLDFAHIQRIPTRFIPDNLRKHEADLLFRIPYRSGDGEDAREVFIYILIEHQSTPDPSMGFRLLLYMVNIWDRQRRQWLHEKTPVSEWRFLPIIPVVFYTGSQQWETPLSMTTLMDLPDELSQSTPHFSSLILKLKRTAPEKLTESGHPFGWLLRAIQKEDSSEKELEWEIKAAVQNLSAMAEEDRAEWEKAIYYLYLLVHHRRKPKEGERLKEKISDEVRSTRGRKAAATMARNLAEQMMEEGKKKGREEGTLRAKQDTLTGLMTEKLGPVPERVAKRVRLLEDTETLDRLLRQLLHSYSLEEMNL